MQAPQDKLLLNIAKEAGFPFLTELRARLFYGDLLSWAAWFELREEERQKSLRDAKSKSPGIPSGGRRGRRRR